MLQADNLDILMAKVNEICQMLFQCAYKSVSFKKSQIDLKSVLKFYLFDQLRMRVAFVDGDRQIYDIQARGHKKQRAFGAEMVPYAGTRTAAGCVCLCAVIYGSDGSNYDSYLYDLL